MGAHGFRKIPYPKHVWSPAGGWYSQPANWKQNTAIAGATMFGIVCLVWKCSAERETWTHKPEAGRFYPSRYWSRQLRNWDREDRLKAEAEKNEKA